jgi:hypothetical protein
MCFSPTASFVAAGVAGVIGIVSIARVMRPHELLLAATPILFGIQQGIEGLLWLTLQQSPGGPASAGLTLLYLLMAEVLWPIYAPATVLLIEPNQTRRRFMLVCLAAGTAVSAYLLWWIVTRPYGARILDDHIVYMTGQRDSSVVAIAYLAATGISLVLSSQRTVFVLGAVVLTGAVTAYVLYWEAFVSVWCFFAAAASAVILCHFEWARRQRLRIGRT